MTTDQEIEAVARAIAGARGVEPSIFDRALADHNGLVKEHPGYDLGSSMVCDVLRDARSAIAALDAIRAQDDGWRTMDDAPRGQRILVLSSSGERYAAHWVQNPFTGDEGWLISQVGEDQHIVKPVRWRPLPAPPKGGE